MSKAVYGFSISMYGNVKKLLLALLLHSGTVGFTLSNVKVIVMSAICKMFAGDIFFQLKCLLISKI